MSESVALVKGIFGLEIDTVDIGKMMSRSIPRL